MFQNKDYQLYFRFVLTISCFFIVSINASSVSSVPYTGKNFPTLSSWVKACCSLPKNRKNAHEKKASAFSSLGSKSLQWKEFSMVLSAWFSMMQSGPLSREHLWKTSNVQTTMPSSDFFDLKKSGFFIPFVEKLQAQPDDEFYIRGDLHGDIFSLLGQLDAMKKNGVLDDHFRITSAHVWIVFLGDYVDRGQYGCEVLYTMLRLSLANPDRVLFVRGNHEDIALTGRFHPGAYGFKEEVHHKFNDIDGSIHATISHMNDFLPVAWYLGCKDSALEITHYILCCHGGLEIGYDPAPFLDDTGTRYQLLGELHRNTFIQNFKKYCDERSFWQRWKDTLLQQGSCHEMSKWWDGIALLHNHDKKFIEDHVVLKAPMDAFHLGFMWNDFDVHDHEQVHYKLGRGMIYGHQATKHILAFESSNVSKIHGVFRAHQHGDSAMMDGLVKNRGVYKLWHALENLCAPYFRKCDDGLVWTFNVGADSVFGEHYKFDFDAYARVIVQSSFKDWKMQVFNTDVMSSSLCAAA